MDDKGRLAIDDLYVKDYDSTCITNPFPAIAWGCNFEADMCNWTLKPGTKAQWMVANGTYKGGARIPFAPYTDHTIQKCKSFILIFSFA